MEVAPDRLRRELPEEAGVLYPAEDALLVLADDSLAELRNGSATGSSASDGSILTWGTSWNNFEGSRLRFLLGPGASAGLVGEIEGVDPCVETLLRILLGDFLTTGLTSGVTDGVRDSDKDLLKWPLVRNRYGPSADVADSIDLTVGTPEASSDACQPFLHASSQLLQRHSQLSSPKYCVP